MRWAARSSFLPSAHNPVGAALMEERMAQYMLLLRETPATYADLGTAEMEVIIERYRA